MNPDNNNPYASGESTTASEIAVAFPTAGLLGLAGLLAVLVAACAYYSTATPGSNWDTILTFWGAPITALVLVAVASNRAGNRLIGWLVVVPFVTASAWVAFATLCTGLTLVTGPLYTVPSLGEFHWSHGWKSPAVRIGINSGVATFVASGLIVIFFRYLNHEKKKKNERSSGARVGYSAEPT